MFALTDLLSVGTISVSSKINILKDIMIFLRIKSLFCVLAFVILISCAYLHKCAVVI